jgi:NitT/TauT family transport system ATP-binding protein
MDDLLRMDRLSVRFKGADRDGVLALDDVSLSIRRGEFLVVVGPSGCGKSTLLRVIAGLIEGTGGSVVRDPAIGHQGGIGMVFQDPSLMHWRRVHGNVTIAGEILKIPRKEREETAGRLLDRVGLGRFRDAYPWQLSGGMRQRVAICRALLPDPPLLLMDEPFGALDAITRERMNLFVQRLWADTHKTIIFVTHSVEEAVFLSDRLVTMTPRPGRVADILENHLPRPRDSQSYSLPLFAEYAARVRNTIMASAAEADNVYAE